jgi:hypothetical protein
MNQERRETAKILCMTEDQILEAERRAQAFREMAEEFCPQGGLLFGDLGREEGAADALFLVLAHETDTVKQSIVAQARPEPL